MYKLSEINNAIYGGIKNSDFKINGIIFWPIVVGKQYIYINDNEFDKLKTFND